MSFFRKILGAEPLSDEQKVEKEKAAQERKAQRKQEQQEKEEKSQAQQVKYFGKAGFVNSVTFSAFSGTIKHFEEFILADGEEVLAGLPAEYDKTKQREIKGMLIATNVQLHFVSLFHHNKTQQFHETFDYAKMNGIALAPDGFLSKELLIDIGRSRKKFDDINNDDVFRHFLDIVKEQMNVSKKARPAGRSSRPAPAGDKYKQLEQIGKLKEQGILTEEEFEAEKKKILNA